MGAHIHKFKDNNATPLVSEIYVLHMAFAYHEL